MAKPFETGRQMTAYGALQEMTTFVIYKKQQQLAEAEGNKTLADAYRLIAKDEMAHAQYYMRFSALPRRGPRGTASRTSATSIYNFTMPAYELVPDYDSRIEVMRTAGIDRGVFLTEIWGPVFKRVKLHAARSAAKKPKRDRACPRRPFGGAGLSQWLRRPATSRSSAWAAAFRTRGTWWSCGVVVRNGEVTFEEIGDTRWKHSSFYSSDARAVDKTYVRKGGFIDGVDEFAALHYGLAPRRVQVTDPQHRLLVETVRQALQDAGYEKRPLNRAETGVFVGASVSEYKDLLTARLRAAVDGRRHVRRHAVSGRD